LNCLPLEATSSLLMSFLYFLTFYHSDVNPFVFSLTLKNFRGPSSKSLLKMVESNESFASMSVITTSGPGMLLDSKWIMYN
jgi:hypothetical protein